MVTILVMSAKMATLSFLKIKVFQNKDYDIIVSVHDVTAKFYNVTLTFYNVLYRRCGHVTKVW